MKELSASTAVAAGNYRWTICSLIFFATTINYLDRQVISLLKEDYLDPLFNWSESDYANIVVSFQVAYAAGMLGAGLLIDRLGTRIGYSVVLAAWSVAAALHGLASSTLGFIGARVLLGLSEAGNFPAALKATAEWFPKKERALAAGIFNSGSSLGAIVAPLTVPFIAIALGWQWAFIITGLAGAIWLVFWLKNYDVPGRHKKISPQELSYIKRDDPVNDESATGHVRVKWYALLQYRQTWVFIAGKFFTDPVWWFYFFWLPSFLKNEYGMEKTDLALPVAFVYVLSAAGSIYGGWVSGKLISRGWQVYRARKTALFVFAVLAVPVVSAQALGACHPWLAIAIIGLAAAAHQGWSANILTTPSDMFPARYVGSVVGIGGMAGALGGMILARTAGLLLDHYQRLGAISTGYYVLFIICGGAYLLAFMFMHFLLPAMKKAGLPEG